MQNDRAFPSTFCGFARKGVSLKCRVDRNLLYSENSENGFLDVNVEEVQNLRVDKKKQSRRNAMLTQNDFRKRKNTGGKRKKTVMYNAED